MIILSVEMLKVLEKCAIGDFNGHVGKNRDGYKSAHGEFEYDQ